MSKYKLLAICQCCGEVNVIKEGEDKQALDDRCRIFTEDNKEFDESALVQKAYAELKVTNSKEYLEKIEKMETVFEKAAETNPSMKAILQLHEIAQKMFLDVAPKYFGHDFEVVEVVAEL